MTTIPFQELVDFIQSQPDGKEINMSESNSRYAKCGCVLVHFGKHKKIGIVSAGHAYLGSSYRVEDTNNQCSSLIRTYETKHITTYAEAKEILTQLTK